MIIKIESKDKLIIEHHVWTINENIYYMSTIDYRHKTPCWMTNYGNILSFTKNFIQYSLDDALVIFKDCKISFENLPTKKEANH